MTGCAEKIEDDNAFGLWQVYCIGTTRLAIQLQPCEEGICTSDNSPFGQTGILRINQRSALSMPYLKSRRMIDVAPGGN
jgi:hypothetical protein